MRLTAANTIKAAISTATIVAPTGVPASMDISIPSAVQHTDSTAEHIVTARKFLYTCMADSAGKTTSAEISSEPTRFIASTMTTAVVMAISRLYASALVPTALAKFSSKVTAKILLYKSANSATTIADSAAHSQTSLIVSVSMDVEPNSVLQTSPERLDDLEKRFMSR